MKQITILASLVFLVLIWDQEAAAQDAQALLRQSSETYVRLRTYHFEGQSEIKIAMDDVNYLLRENIEIARGDTVDQANLARVTDFSWQSPTGKGVKYPTFPLGYNYDFAGFGSNIKSASILREETLEANGKPAACYVIETYHRPDITASTSSDPPPETIWIDKVSHLALRLSFEKRQRASTSQSALKINYTVTFTKYTINGDPPQWLLDARAAFEKRVADRVAAMVAQPAAEIHLHDLSGSEISLSQFRGHVVVLDFWATWCAPCRAEIGLTRKIEKEWSGKGLIVLRVTDEAAEDVRRFQENTRQTFKTYVDASGAFQKYGIQGRPTHIIIDKEQVISSYDESSLTEAELIDRLKKAGIN